MLSILVELSGFAAALLFILGLKQLSSPATALQGIVLAGIGMLVAVLASFGYLADVDEAARPHRVANLGLALLALALGIGWAWRSGKRVAMTAMPQMVALYNGMGGGAAAAVAAVELTGPHSTDGLQLSVTTLGALIGSVSLAGVS